ncbi:hypothetical protein M758_4G130700 [Ceratodon purpureus]|nr:hypothetical protein M758_4G130700 [Ceratodon purpureus]
MIISTESTRPRSMQEWLAPARECHESWTQSGEHEVASGSGIGSEEAAAVAMAAAEIR